MKKLVVFDWNGTLLADTRACMAADNHVLETFGGTPVSLKQYRDTMIIPAINFYVKHGCNREKLVNNSQRLGEVFHSFYEPRAAKCRSRKGARALLEWLSKNNIQSIVLSNHTTEGINFQLKRLKINKYISEVIANSSLDNSMKKRNKKEKLEQYLLQHNYQPTEAIIIGDSMEETEIGKSLSIESVAISEGYYSTARLKKAIPNFFIHNLLELIDILKR